LDFYFIIEMFFKRLRNFFQNSWSKHFEDVLKKIYFQKILFEEITLDDDFCKILKLQNDVKENDDFKNAKIYKIYKDISDVIYIGSTCDTLSKCMSKFRIKSKSRVNWS
jgi:hypothetical protein